MAAENGVAAIAPDALVDHYLPLPGSYDEMRTPEGVVRPHWQYLLHALHALGPAVIEERRREAGRLIRDNGVTYNVYGDPRGMSRPWDLDLLPLLIRSDDWAELERGLMQRAEGLGRLLRISIFKLAERTGSAREQDSHCERSLLEALTLQTQSFPGFVGEGAEGRLSDPVPEMLSLISDPNRLGALPQTLQALGQAAWSVRDRLSADTWRVVNGIEVCLRALTKRPPEELAGALDELDPLITSLVAFSALTHENMTHNEGWHFLEAGRRLERCNNLTTLLQATLAPVIADSQEALVVEAVLGVTDSLITYRRRYQAGTRIGALLDLVYQDEFNPRALAYQLLQLQQLVADMPRAEFAGGLTQLEKRVLKALTGVRLAEIDMLIQPDRSSERRESLDAQLTVLGDELAAISDALTAQYFRHEEQPHNLLSRRDGDTP